MFSSFFIVFMLFWVENQASVATSSCCRAGWWALNALVDASGALHAC